MSLSHGWARKLSCTLLVVVPLLRPFKDKGHRSCATPCSLPGPHGFNSSKHIARGQGQVQVTSASLGRKQHPYPELSSPNTHRSHRI